jgi:hypothetical protein
MVKWKKFKKILLWNREIILTNLKVPQEPLYLTRYTTAVSISCESRRAFAEGPMIVHCAFSSRCTGIVVRARVHTSSISTSLAKCTFIVTCTANFNWSS